MDKTIPMGAAVLLTFIANTEVSRAAPECYEVIYGHNQSKLPKPLTQMTLAEVQAAQGTWSSKYGSSACGAYQFMKATLAGLMTELSLLPSQRFDGNLQDRLGYHLLKRRGYLDFVAGKISREEFGKRLAQEWASFPVLAPTRGAKRALVRGQSYYAGDGLNKALVNPEKVEEVLHEVLRAHMRETAPSTQTTLPYTPPAPAPINVDVPPVQPEEVTSVNPNVGVISGLLVTGTLALASLGAYLSNLPCSWLGLGCGN